jgi:xylulokinase
VGAGFYADPVTPVSAMVKIRETIDPDPAMHERYEAFFSVWRTVYEQLRDSMDRHRELLEKYRLGGNT